MSSHHSVGDVLMVLAHGINILPWKSMRKMQWSQCSLLYSPSISFEHNYFLDNHCV